MLAFAKLQGLSEAETLACFGRFYREDVLKNPDGTDHQNIRNFMRTGWRGSRLKPPRCLPPPR
ncbi:MAG: HopJ type III effector protein [Solimonas sp.]